MRNETIDFRDSMNHRIANGSGKKETKAAPKYIQEVWQKLNDCTGPNEYNEVLKEFRDRIRRWNSGKLNLNK